LALFRALNAISKTRAVFFITFGFLASTEFALSVLGCGYAIFELLHGLIPLFGIYFVFTILAFAKRSTYSIVLETFAV